MTSVLLQPTRTGVGMQATTTSAHVQDAATGVNIELIDIYSIYYWLHPAQFAAEHREVGIDDKSDA
jgi:hypothetical protein